jgi:hypothetical protein
MVAPGFFIANSHGAAVAISGAGSLPSCPARHRFSYMVQHLAPYCAFGIKDQANPLVTVKVPEMCSQDNREAGIDRAAAFALTAKHLSHKGLISPTRIDCMQQP